MNCPNCRTAQLVMIDLSIQEDAVRLHSCSNCDTRWWERNGERIELPSVLELATVRR